MHTPREGPATPRWQFWTSASVDRSAAGAYLNLLTLDPETRPLPVIVCSSAIQSLHEHQDLLSKYGICALPKPFDIEALLDAVARMLPDE